MGWWVGSMMDVSCEVHHHLLDDGMSEDEQESCHGIPGCCSPDEVDMDENDSSVVVVVDDTAGSTWYSRDAVTLGESLDKNLVVAEDYEGVFVLACCCLEELHILGKMEARQRYPCQQRQRRQPTRACA